MNPAEPKVEGDERYLWGFDSWWYHRIPEVDEPTPHIRCKAVPYRYDVEEDKLIYKGKCMTPRSNSLCREYEKYEENGAKKEQVVRDRRVIQISEENGWLVILMLYTREEALKIVSDAFKKQASDYDSYRKDLFAKVGHI